MTLLGFIGLNIVLLAFVLFVYFTSKDAEKFERDLDKLLKQNQ